MGERDIGQIDIILSVVEAEEVLANLPRDEVQMREHSHLWLASGSRSNTKHQNGILLWLLLFDLAHFGSLVDEIGVRVDLEANLCSEGKMNLLSLIVHDNSLELWQLLLRLEIEDGTDRGL